MILAWTNLYADVQCVPYDESRDLKLEKGITFEIFSREPFNMFPRAGTIVKARYTDGESYVETVNLKHIAPPENEQGVNAVWDGGRGNLYLEIYSAMNQTQYYRPGINVTPAYVFRRNLTGTGMNLLGTVLCEGLKY